MSSKMKALIIDDEKNIRLTLSGIIEDEGWGVETAESGLVGIEKFQSLRPNIVFLDVWMKGLDGIETLQKLREIDSKCPVVIMSGHGTIETAVKATKIGAFDYLEKPLSLDKILPLLEHAKNIAKFTEETIGSGPSFIGDSKPIQIIKKQIGLVSSKNNWILISGENGTGKEELAKSIHSTSNRSGKPFVSVACAGWAGAELHEHLFGQGSEGAVSKFELANNGTIFLDEVSLLSLSSQEILIKILEDQSFLRNSEIVNTDVRLIAATNKNLKALVSEGLFREDLYFKLNIIPLHLLPLRERGSDILLLADYFIDRSCSEINEPKKNFTQAAKNLLMSYRWPGNVRELKNLMERLCIMVPGEKVDYDDLYPIIDIADSPLGIETMDEAQTLRQAKSIFEKNFIKKKLEDNQWNITKTSEEIGLERSNLHKKIKLYKLDK